MFKGCGTALVTPFKTDLTVDQAALKKLVQRQIQAGIDYLVPLGTTGEAACLENEEKVAILKLIVEEVAHKVPVVAGAGSNSTKQTIDNIHLLEKTGIDGFLIVTPYYNKPTQTGLYNHFQAIAAETTKPIIMYNVPTRTSVNMTAETCLKLAAIPNIVGIKEASSNFGQIEEIIRHAPPHFSVISGNDADTFALIALGAQGLISVASNLYPKILGIFVNRLLANDFLQARELHYQLTSLFEHCFIETNPIPVKAGLYHLGLIENILRPPLYAGASQTLLTIANTIGQLKSLV